MGAAGLQAPVRADIRAEIWVKLWGNLSFNPISALTGATLAEIVEDEGTRALARAMMVEAEAIAGKLGVQLPIDVDQRIAGAGKVGAHKTSMLQDLEAGRPMELEAIVGAVVELGERLGVSMPATRTCRSPAGSGRRSPKRCSWSRSRMRSGRSRPERISTISTGCSSRPATSSLASS